jgi:hypothetical protein
MAEFFKHDSSGILMLGFFLVVGVLIVATVITFYWMQTRREEMRASLLRDLLDRGVPPDQVERLVNATTEANASDKRLEGKLAAVMIENEVPAGTMERVLRIYQHTDPATKQAMFKAIEEMVESSPTEEQLLAAMTALCPARTEAPPPPRLEQAPASA